MFGNSLHHRPRQMLKVALQVEPADVPAGTEIDDVKYSVTPPAPVAPHVLDENLTSPVVSLVLMREPAPVPHKRPTFVI